MDLFEEGQRQRAACRVSEVSRVSLTRKHGSLIAPAPGPPSGTTAKPFCLNSMDFLHSTPEVERDRSMDALPAQGMRVEPDDQRLGEGGELGVRAGDEPARILEVIAPAGFEKFFEALVDLGRRRLIRGRCLPSAPSTSSRPTPQVSPAGSRLTVSRFPEDHRPSSYHGAGCPLRGSGFIGRR